MKRALIRLTIFAFVIFIVDLLSAVPFNYLKNHAKDGRRDVLYIYVTMLKLMLS
jgi:mannose/fructose-specific phosphotransferase system component IIA